MLLVVRRAAVARGGGGVVRATARWASQGLTPLPTRKQAFKEHLWSLRQQDPARWTSRTIAYHFRLPLANVQAMLALQELEVEAKKVGIDPNLLELAEDAEEYLDSEYDEPTPPPARASSSTPAEEVFFDDEAAGAGSLDELSHEQELAIVGALATRLSLAPPSPGVGPGEALGAAVRDAIGSLTLDELRALNEELTGDGEAAAPAAATDDEESRRRAQRALLNALTSDAPEALLAEGDGADFAQLAELPELSDVEASGGGAFVPTSTVSTDGLGTWKPPAGAFWVDGSAPAPQMPQMDASARSVQNDGLTITQLVPQREGAATWRAAEQSFGRGPGEKAPLGVATAPEELRMVREPEFGERMAANLEKRSRRLSADQPGSNVVGQTPNRGRMVFTEVVRPHRKVPLAARVWVSERGQPYARKPTEHERRMSQLRVQPPLLMPRMKRNR